MSYAQRYRRTPFGAPRYGKRAVTPADKLAAARNLTAWVSYTVRSGQYYQVRGRFIQSGVAVPSGGRPAADPGSSA